MNMLRYFASNLLDAWKKAMYVIPIILLGYFIQFYIPIAFAQEVATDSASEALRSIEEDVQNLSDLGSNNILKNFSDFDNSIKSANLRLDPLVKKLYKKSFQVNENIQLRIQNIDDEKFSIKVIDAKGRDKKVSIKNEKFANQIISTISSYSEFTPGKYKIQVVNTEGKVISEEDFLWGVLAINTNKASYSPGEKANIAMAVLDEKGMMICDAELTLEIQSPDGSIKKLTTKDGIRINDACRIKAVTEKPDYEAEYITVGKGYYMLHLHAITKNGEYSIDDSFTVEEKARFDVERITATRIYPKEVYEVQIKIKANEDFNGFIQENIPESFLVIPENESENNVFTVAKKEKNISEERDMKASEYNLIPPVKESSTLTGLFGDQLHDPILKEKYHKYGLRGHDGIDFAVPEKTEVFAVDNGEVALVEEKGDYGATIVIKHAWGNSYYGHLSEFKVKVGDVVQKQDIIALSGNSGLSTNPHLHFGIKLSEHDVNNGYYGKIDPSSYIGLQQETPDVLGESTQETGLKTITWRKKITKGEEITLSYLYDAPDKSPDLYKIGPLEFFEAYADDLLTNSKFVFREGRQWQIAVDEPDSNGMLVYSGDEDATPHYRDWNGSDLSSENDMVSGESNHGEVVRTLLKSSPTENEYIYGAATWGAGGSANESHLDIQVFDSGVWGDGGNAPTNGEFTTDLMDSVSGTENWYTPFDISYEQETGEALVVYENDASVNNSTVAYRTWDGTDWSEEALWTFPSTDTTNEVRYVRMVSRPGTDDILVVVSTGSGDMTFGLWDGNQFDTANDAEITNALSSAVHQTWDVVWEGSGDAAIIVWGTGTVLDYCTFDGTDCTNQDPTTTGLTTAGGTAARYVELASNPDNEYIALMVSNTQSSMDLYVDVWDGTDWDTPASEPGPEVSIEEGAVDDVTQVFDVSWETGSDQALFAFVETGLSTLDYFIYDISDDSWTCPESGGTVTDLNNTEGSGSGPCNESSISFADDIGEVRLIPSKTDGQIMMMGYNNISSPFRPELMLWSGTGNSWSQTAIMGSYESDLSPDTWTSPAASDNQPLATHFAWESPDIDGEVELPVLDQQMRHGKWFNNGAIQPFTF